MQYLLSLQEKGLCHSVYLHESGSSWQHLASSAVPPPHNTVPIALARSASQSTLTSLPTTQFGDSFGSNGDDIIRVVLKRGGGGIGLSIVAAQGVGDRHIGIYVKKVVDGRPAALDGRLSAGDQLLSVNGHSLLGISQEEAAEFMSRSGAEVHFEVRKGAALRNGLSTWLCQQTPTSVSSCGTASFVPPSPSSQSHHSHQNAPNSGIGLFSNYAPISKHGSQQSMQTPNYQRNQTSSVRTSAYIPPPTFFEANQHGRSISASELYQNDPNASFSQRSIASTTGSGFDRLPAHYRHSNRPIVYQPCWSFFPPISLFLFSYHKNSFTTKGLFHSNFRSPNPLQGYVSTATRESTQDLFRTSLPSSPPAARSSPREEYRNLPFNSSTISSSECQPSSLNLSNYSTINNYALSNRPNINANIPRATVGPSFQNASCAGSSGYEVLNTSRNQESAVVRPMKYAINIESNRTDVRRREDERATTTFGVRGTLPMTFSQYHPHEQNSGYGGQRIVEKANTSVNSRDVVNDELDRLDAKGFNMSNEEMRRYRELLHVAAEDNRLVRTVDGFSVNNRTETLIDDVDMSPGRSALSRENISPNDSKGTEKKSVQFKEQTNLKESEDFRDSPGIVGAQEVYRDPRQRRLNELQERQMLALKSSDGAQLGFRDKMKMFATQLGESSPKQRVSASSAKRQIVNDQ
uniref:PDZ domain-containing protein n=1 Tax=Heterorhabditis bacteriophora TaxID=37862 RepID=A0A1I7XHQ0_HETBA